MHKTRASVFKEDSRHFLPLPCSALLMCEAVWDGGWSCSGTRPEALTEAGVWARIHIPTLSNRVLILKQQA